MDRRRMLALRAAAMPIPLNDEERSRRYMVLEWVDGK